MRGLAQLQRAVEQPFRLTALQISARTEGQSAFGICGNPRSLVGSMGCIHSYKETISKDRGNLEKLVPRAFPFVPLLLSKIPVQSFYQALTGACMNHVPCCRQYF